MTDTEQKILEAALKLFSKKGYKGATTKAIAEESGYSEYTLFRKFKSKDRLYEKVMIRASEKLKTEFQSILKDQEFENHHDFLEYLVENMHQVTQNNFEFLNLVIYSNNNTPNSLVSSYIDYLTDYIKKMLPGQEIDYDSFTMTLFTFIYMINLRKYRKNIVSNDEALIKGFIKNLNLSLR